MLTSDVNCEIECLPQRQLNTQSPVVCILADEQSSDSKAKYAALAPSILTSPTGLSHCR
jgi:hypothetical protein